MDVNAPCIDINCKYPGPHHTVLTPDSTHYAKLLCGKCDRFLGWLPKPDGEPTKYKREAEHKDLVRKFSKGYCELCLLKEGDLRSRQTLVAHHVVAYKNGGKAIRENIWILCSACHALVEYQRRYHGVATVGEILSDWPDGSQREQF
jgi:hypothetical protein